MWRLLLFILLPILPFYLSAQTKQITTQGNAWYDFTETIRANPRWSVIVTLSERHTLDSVEQTQFVARTYFLHHFKSDWSLGAGYAGFWNWQGDLIVPELRPEQWILYRQRFSKIEWFTVNHRYKMEERFARKTAGDSLAKGYDFTMRFRYRVGLDFVMFTTGKSKNPFKFLLTEEIFLQAGKTIAYNIFDQNRVTAGFSYNPIPEIVLSAAYMHIFRQRRNGTSFDDIHTLRIGIEHILTIKPKKKPAELR